jgi:hypothetical protein
MQGYITWSLGPLITVFYSGYIEASKQSYRTGSLGIFITI